MSEKNRIVVEGFSFSNEAEAAQAGKEADGIKYIREKINMDMPENVLTIYNQLIRQKLFETAVGYAYLKELQDYLVSIPFIKTEEILPIPVQHPVLEEDIRKKPRVKEKPQVQVRNFDFKKRYQIAFFTSAVLLLCVIGMFIVSSTSNSPNILNYETKLINKYEQWEQELEQREAEVSERENQVGQD